MAETTGKMQLGSEDSLRRLLDSLKDVKKVTSIHCEDSSLIEQERGRDLEEHLRSRSNECETSAIKKVLRWAQGLNIHICHVSTAESLELLAGKQFTSEVTPHHLLLDVNSSLKAFGKVNPPLRGKEDREKLWDAFLNGKADILASDHAPHTIDEKADFETAPSGVPGVETSYPLMLRLVRKGLLPLERLVSAFSEKPARIFGLKKGRIHPGYDGDFIVVDFKEVRKIKGEDLHSKCRWTPFEGWEATFLKATFLRGERVAEDGEVIEERLGRFLS